jgi:hypothetical protein
MPTLPSSWQDMDNINNCADLKPNRPVAGVYWIRLAQRDGNPCRVGRFLDDDKDGILAIGKSANLFRRIDEFNRACEGRLGHSEGERFFLVTIASRFAEKYDGPRLQFGYEPLIDKAQAHKREAELFKEYFQRYGELPPLNSNLSDMDSSWVYSADSRR